MVRKAVSYIERGLISGVLILGVCLGFPARAAFAVPIRALQLRMDVMPAYSTCTSPDSLTNSGFDACVSSLSLADNVCKMTNRGKGRIKLRATHTDVRVTGEIRGIEDICESQTLALILSLRITTDDCGAPPPSSCTLVDLVDLPIGECQVVNGTCKIVTSLNTSVPSLILEARKTHIELLGCGYVRTTGTALPARTFSCGLLVP